jgi:hypothetical protein
VRVLGDFWAKDGKALERKKNPTVKKTTDIRFPFITFTFKQKYYPIHLSKTRANS